MLDDDTRVILEPMEDNQSDYINANYISVIMNINERIFF